MARPKATHSPPALIIPQCIRPRIIDFCKTVKDQTFKLGDGSKVSLSRKNSRDIILALDDLITRTSYQDAKLTTSGAKKITEDIVKDVASLRRSLMQFERNFSARSFAETRLARVLGIDRDGVIILRKQLCQLNRITVDELFGSQTSRPNITYDPDLNRALLQVYRDIGGVPTKTTSTQGNSSNLAANFLFDLGQIIIKTFPDVKKYVFSSNATAETFVKNELAKQDK